MIDILSETPHHTSDVRREQQILRMTNALNNRRLFYIHRQSLFGDPVIFETESYQIAYAFQVFVLVDSSPANIPHNGHMRAQLVDVRRVFSTREDAEEELVLAKLTNDYD